MVHARCGYCGAAMQITGGSSERYYRCVSNRKRGTCTNRLSVRERLTRQQILEAIRQALETPSAIAYVRQRFAERIGAISRDASRELAERSARLERTDERIRGIILMQADGDRSPMVAQMRHDLEAQAADERSAVAELRTQTSAPIRLPPLDLLTERVFALRALAETEDVQAARAALQSYFAGSTITMTPEPHGEGQAYVARGNFMPLALLVDQNRQSQNALRARAGRALFTCSCAGAILDFPDIGNAEEAACWIPFNEVVAVGWA
jgi:hypothetical protein